MTATIVWTRPFNLSVQFELYFSTYLAVVAVLLGTFIVTNLSYSLHKLLKTYRHVCELTRGCSLHETKAIYTIAFASRTGVGLLKWITLQLNFGTILLCCLIQIIQMLLNLLSKMSSYNCLYLQAWITSLTTTYSYYIRRPRQYFRIQYWKWSAFSLI